MIHSSLNICIIGAYALLYLLRLKGNNKEKQLEEKGNYDE